MNNNCCEIFPDLMERVWEVSCSCPQGGSQPMDDYYTKIQTDARIQRAKDDVENDIEGLARDIEAIETDIADTYSKEETDTKLSLKANLSDVYDKTATDGLLATKASTATTADLQAQINSKQDILVSGVNLKTLNGESLLGSGNIVISAGSGVTPEQVETMIDEAVSGKQDTSGMTAYTTTSTTAALNNIVTAHVSDAVIHVSATDKTNWNAKVDQSDLDDYATTATVATKADITALTQVNGVLTAHTSDTVVHTTAAEKIAWNNKVDQSDLDDYATTATVATKADITALTQVNGVLTAHTADTVVHTTSTEKANWNSKLDPSALNGYATQQWVEGKGYLTGYTETDPIFTGSPAYTITNADKTAWNGAATNASNAISQLNGYSLLKISKSAFDALSTKDPNTIYLVYQD